MVERFSATFIFPMKKLLTIILLDAILLSSCENTLQKDFSPPPQEEISEEVNVNLEGNIKTVVFVLSMVNEVVSARGSGLLISEDGLILTNAHVVLNEIGEAYSEFLIGNTVSVHEEAQCFSHANLIAADQELDLALLQGTTPLDENCQPIEEFREFWYIDLATKSRELELGAEVDVVGFPGIGEFTVTLTRGHVSGFLPGDGLLPKRIKTDTVVSPGNSGGAAFDSNGNFIGVPFLVYSDPDTATSLGQIIPAEIIQHWIDRLVDQGILKITDGEA